MTVSGLWKLLQEYPQTRMNLAKEALLYYRLKKKKMCIGIDASIYIYLALKNSKNLEEVAVDFVLSHDISCYLHSYLESLRHFLVVVCNVNIILVFDGASHPNKEITQKARREASVLAKLKLKRFIEGISYSEEALNKILKEIVRPNGAVVASVRRWALI